MGGVRSYKDVFCPLPFILICFYLCKVRKSVPPQPSAILWPIAQELTDHALKLLELRATNFPLLLSFFPRYLSQ